MTESLSKRVTRVIAANFHYSVNKLEDKNPLAILEQFIRELQLLTAEVRAELGKVVSQRHLLQQQLLRLNKEHDNLMDHIQVALQECREDLARVAVGRQIDIERQLPILEEGLADVLKQEQELSRYADALNGKQREMRLAIAEYEKTLQSTQQLTKQANQKEHAHRAEFIQAEFDRVYERSTGISTLDKQASLAQKSQLGELHDLVRDNEINVRLLQIRGQ